MTLSRLSNTVFKRVVRQVSKVTVLLIHLCTQYLNIHFFADPQISVPLMEKLRMRMIANSAEDIATILHCGEPSVVELVYRNFGRLKVCFTHHLLSCAGEVK